MKTPPLLATMVLLAAVTSTPVLAADRERKPSRAHQQALAKRAAGWFDHRMQAVHHNTAPDAPAYGWRYFTDPASRRAVVISPQGDYYYSQGKGLQWVDAQQI